MNERRDAPFRVKLCTAVLLGGTAFFTALGTPAGETSAGESEFLDCRTVQPDEARLACYDEAAARPADPLPSSSTALFGLPPDEARKRAEDELGRPQPEALEARIAGLRTLPTGKLEFELDNGQRWVQTDTGRLQLKMGDAVRIRRASLGSYLLQRQLDGAWGGAGYRVRRIS